MAEDRRIRRAGVDSSLRTAQVWDAVLALASQLEESAPRRSDAPASETSRASRTSQASQTSGVSETLGMFEATGGNAGRLRVLDLGGGTGGIAVPLAELGHDVLVIDPSPDALAALDRRSADAGVGDRLRAVQGDTATLGTLCRPGSIDLVCCHGVLEYVDDPAAALQAIVTALAPGGGLSILVANRLAAVLSRTVVGRFDQARAVLESPQGRWGEGDPLPRRFHPDEINQLVADAGLDIVSEQGVRVLADLAPAAAAENSSQRADLLDLERAIGGDPAAGPLARVASAWHVLGRRPS